MIGQADQSTDHFFGILPPSKGDGGKTIIGRWYVRNDLSPTEYAYVTHCKRPKVVYTSFLRDKGI